MTNFRSWKWFQIYIFLGAVSFVGVSHDNQMPCMLAILRYRSRASFGWHFSFRCLTAANGDNHNSFVFDNKSKIKYIFCTLNKEQNNNNNKKKQVKCEKWIRRDHEQWLSQPINILWVKLISFCCCCQECPSGNIQSVNICWMELIGLHICTKLPADHFTLILARKFASCIHTLSDYAYT